MHAGRKASLCCWIVAALVVVATIAGLPANAAVPSKRSTPWQPVSSGASFQADAQLMAVDRQGRAWMLEAMVLPDGAMESRLRYVDGGQLVDAGGVFDGSIHHLEPDLLRGGVVVKGDFTRAGTASVRGLARWNGSQWVEIAGGIPNDSLVRAMAVDAATGDVFLAGEFTTINGAAIAGIGRWREASAQWSVFPRPPFNETSIAFDTETGTLVAAGSAINELAVLSGGGWIQPRFENGDTAAGLQPGMLEAAGSQGVYVADRSYPGPVGSSLLRVRGTVLHADPRARGFFERLSWDAARGQLIACCGRDSGGTGDLVALRVSDANVTPLPRLFDEQGPWPSVFLEAGGGETYALHARGDVLHLARLEAGAWRVIANAVDPRSGEPTWNEATGELFVRSPHAPSLVVRSSEGWTTVSFEDPHTSVSSVRSAGIDGTVIAGPETSDRTYVGRWRGGRWIERFSSPEGVSVQFHDAIWDAPNQRYLIAGDIAIRDGATYRRHHVAEVTASGWRGLDVGLPIDSAAGSVFALDPGGCAGGVLAIGAITRWGGAAAQGAGCIVGSTPAAYPPLPDATAYVTVAGPEAGVRHFWLPSGILRRDADGDRFVGRPSGSTALVRDLIVDRATSSLIAVGAFLSMDGRPANSVARLTRSGWVAVAGVRPHSDLHAAWNERERALVAGAIDGTTDAFGGTDLALARINLPPRVTSVGVLSGVPEVGQTLRYSKGTSVDGDGDPLTESWRWMRDGVAIPDAVSETYVVRREDRGRAIAVEYSTSDGEEADRATSTPLVVRNRPPEVASGRASGLEDEGVRITLARFEGSAVDPDGDPLHLSIPALPTGWRLDRTDATTLVLWPVPGFHGGQSLAVTFCDDLGACTTGSLQVSIQPRLLARPDRFDLPWESTEVAVDVLANDLFVRSRLAGGRLTVLGLEGPGSAVVDARGTPDDASDDRILFRIDRRELTQTRVQYLICESGSTRCSESEALLFRGAFGSRPLVVETGRDRGHHDLEVRGLQGLAGARIHSSGFVDTAILASNVGADPSPSDPWDEGGTFITTGVASVSPGGAIEIQVSAESVGRGRIALYSGLDTNGDGRPSAGEALCSAVSSGTTQHCAFERTAWQGSAPSYWVLAHALEGPDTLRLEISDGSAPLAHAQLVATAPSAATTGGVLPVRMVWNDPTLLPGDVRSGRIVLTNAVGTVLGRVAVRLVRTVGEPVAYALRPDMPYRFDLAPDGRHDHLYVDVPAGLDRLSLLLESDVELQLRASRRPELDPRRAQPEVPAIPAPGPSDTLARTSEGRLRIDIPRPEAGRWYFSPTNRAATRASIVVTASFSGPSRTVRPGGYFNPQRSGSGLFILPAGSDAAALWYTYDQGGLPTWYYLQGAYAGVSHGWSGNLYRSVWLGDRNQLVDVGRATLMPRSTGGVSFSYLLDGEAGAEAYEPFGGGCPTLGGTSLDLSGHWFDPLRAGSGYSIQMFPGYEFFLLFVYDGLGAPRFLVAEAEGFGPQERDITIQQTRGTCPLCPFSEPPVRETVGRLRRTIDRNTLVQLDVQARFGAELPGRWDVIDRVVPLAGPQSLQGCPPR